jgi:hypothetical protein
MAAKRTLEKAKSPRVFGQRRKLPKTFCVGLYARVSTFDQHTIPLQIRALREYAARRGWTIAIQVKEVGSGAGQRELREKLIEAARRRDIDAVLVWRLDRWGRSVADLVSTLQELEHLGVGFVSLTEALDLTTPSGRAMAGLLAVFAQFEREILRERVRAGLAHARQNGFLSTWPESGLWTRMGANVSGGASWVACYLTAGQSNGEPVLAWRFLIEIESQEQTEDSADCIQGDRFRQGKAKQPLPARSQRQPDPGFAKTAARSQ